MFDTTAARDLAKLDHSHPYWAGQMKQALLWACDIIDAANAALEPKSPESARVEGKFKATCCKCGKVDWRDEPVAGVYFCSYACT